MNIKSVPTEDDIDFFEQEYVTPLHNDGQWADSGCSFDVDEYEWENSTC